jgi:hypothetical protein
MSDWHTAHLGEAELRHRLAALGRTGFRRWFELNAVVAGDCDAGLCAGLSLLLLGEGRPDAQVDTEGLTDLLPR